MSSISGESGGSAARFVENLRTSRVLSGVQLRAVADLLDQAGHDEHGGTLAEELVTRGLLTPYQAAALARPTPEPLVLDDYVILEQVGGGGVGLVFRAKHRRLDRIVAMKVLNQELTQNEQAIRRFEQEVRAAGKLTHRHVVMTLDAGETHGVQYLITEFLSGRDLHRVVAEEGPLPVPVAVDYLLQAAEGLAYAHASGVVHRDVKPSNLFLDDQEGAVKILDLGLARIAGAAEQGAAYPPVRLSHTGVLLGTLDFMSPEQASDSSLADERSDVYSLGCTLYFLINGVPIYPRESANGKLRAHRDALIPPLRRDADAVPPDLDLVFQKMVAKSPEDRYPSVRSLVADLRACCERHGWTLGNPPPAGRRLRPAGADTNAVPLPTGFHVTTGSFDNPPHPSPVPQAEPTTPPVSAGGQAPAFRRRSWAAGGAAVLLGGVLILLIAGWTSPVSWRGGRTVEVVTGNEDRADAVGADEAAAREVLRLGGTVEVVTGNGGLVRVTPDKELPPAPFRVRLIDLSGGSVDDDCLAFVHDLAMLECLYLNGTQIGDAGLRRLSGLTELKELGIGRTGVTDAGLAALADCKGLRVLFLHDTKLTGEGLARLEALDELEKLNLDGSAVTDESLRHLRHLARLADVWLNNTRITDAGLAHLKDLPKLRRIKLAGTAVSDLGLEHLRGLTELNWLDLHSTRVVGPGLSHLAGLPRLRDLRLGGGAFVGANLSRLRTFRALRELDLGVTPTTDDDLVHLRGLTEMRVIQLRETRTSAVGRACLERDLPRCNVLPPAGPDARAAVWVLDSGGDVETDRGGAAVKQLEDLPRQPFALVSVRLNGRKEADDAALAKFVGLKRLALIHLNLTPVTDAGMRTLAKIPTLSHVYVYGTKVSDEGVAALKDLRLIVLNAGETNVTDEAATHLRGQDSLEVLVINRTKVSDDFLARLGPLKKLNRLHLEETAISDSGLRHLRSLPELRWLGLSDVEVTDAGAKQLESFEALRRLELDRTRITPTGLAGLRRALPNCQITGSPAGGP